jgi:hypothetical protein
MVTCDRCGTCIGNDTPNSSDSAELIDFLDEAFFESLCNDCLQELKLKLHLAHHDDAEDDLYIENGLIVFKESYHMRRGFCCKSRCRHCPYGFDKPSIQK